jgi:hypothetical protein
MKLKHANGWFAAGPEVARAMALLSDGAFKLFVYLCLQANRDTGRIAVNDRDLAVVQQKSRRSIVSYLDELEQHGICQIESALNQHRRGQIEICTPSSAYHKMPQPASADWWLRQQIRKLRRAPRRRSPSRRQMRNWLPRYGPSRFRWNRLSAPSCWRARANTYLGATAR